MNQKKKKRIIFSRLRFCFPENRNLKICQIYVNLIISRWNTNKLSVGDTWK